MRVSLIVAMSEDRVIGRSGGLPWRLPADLKRFKQLTMGHHIVMGRKTFESLPRMLPGRTSVVITRQPDYQPQGALVAHSLDQALQLAAADDEVFVIGGAEIYQLALPHANRIYMTRVHAKVDGDTQFPDFDEDQWTFARNERHARNEKNQYDYSFQVYDKATCG
jgi:dihydrofolate reductase